MPGVKTQRWRLLWRASGRVEVTLKRGTSDREKEGIRANRGRPLVDDEKCAFVSSAASVPPFYTAVYKEGSGY